ncbi:hypothetical protein [Roseicella frigidaeris]|uniref:Uncharacterized protein n=1 Tax=Roseicella frigidaeris TaxID=2230885 RepID=A0A327MAH1_9PROT|nr:hypothetical protein [Roseicella frigidaeris]RAI59920.1 hypothetical protein DOO78_06660 [Roseicella frigidaeris]
MSGQARSRPAAKPRAAPRQARAAAPRLAPAAAGPLAGWRRWRWVAVLVLAALVGLPLAHAVFGEVVALLGGTFLLGVLVGRWTAG